MKHLLLLAALAAGCAPTGYYVANVYQDPSGTIVQRCAIDGGSHGDKPDPANCKFERVGPPPPEAGAQLGAPPAPPAAPPAAPPTPQ
ncbi:MAG TPA: hypothetical protein VGG28_31825 [Kofleriaceae bacterium]|jgi:hypothetical protein